MIEFNLNMSSKIKVLNFYIILGFVYSNVFVLSDEVPAMLWNIKGNALALKPVSALGSNDKILQESLKDALHQNSEVLIFAVNKLGLEDFYTIDKPTSQNNTLSNIESFLDSQLHMLLPSVKDPLNLFHKAHCGVQEIVVDNKIDGTVLQAVSTSFKKSCVVILHVSDEGLLAEGGSLQDVFMPSFAKSSKNMIGVFTGVTSSWRGSVAEHHAFRHLLQAETSENNNFVNYTGCIIMYAESASIKMGKENATKLQQSPSTEGSSCGNTTLLQLKYEGSGSYSSVTIKFNFVKKMGSWKTVGTVSIEGVKAPEGDIKLNSDFIAAPVGWSYSCGNLVIKGKNASEVQIILERFQIQPFEVKEAFSESFDCVPFFTIPIWMGVIVALIFIVILNIGVYALFSVKTMDRFDDPKGKTISVGAVAD